MKYRFLDNHWLEQRGGEAFSTKSIFSSNSNFSSPPSMIWAQISPTTNGILQDIVLFHFETFKNFGKFQSHRAGAGLILSQISPQLHFDINDNISTQTYTFWDYFPTTAGRLEIEEAQDINISFVEITDVHIYEYTSRSMTIIDCSSTNAAHLMRDARIACYRCPSQKIRRPEEKKKDTNQ